MHKIVIKKGYDALIHCPKLLVVEGRIKFDPALEDVTEAIPTQRMYRHQILRLQRVHQPLHIRKVGMTARVEFSQVESVACNEVKKVSLPF